MIRSQPPSDSNGSVTPGHGFFITGDIKGDRTIPENAVLRVFVLDENKAELRFAESKRKNDDRIDRFCDAFFYYKYTLRVYFEQEDQDTMAQTSNIILIVLAMVAEEESHMKSEAILLRIMTEVPAQWQFDEDNSETVDLLGPAGFISKLAGGFVLWSVWDKKVDIL